MIKKVKIMTIRPGEEFLIDFNKTTCSSTEDEYEKKLLRIQLQMRELGVSLARLDRQ